MNQWTSTPMDGVYDAGASCLCRAKHAPVPLTYQWHHIRPKGMGGEDTPYNVPDRNALWLCATTHDNVHEILRLMVAANAALTFGAIQKVKTRPVSKYAHSLAVEGFIRFRDNLWGAV